MMDGMKVERIVVWLIVWPVHQQRQLWSIERTPSSTFKGRSPTTFHKALAIT